MSTVNRTRTFLVLSVSRAFSAPKWDHYIASQNLTFDCFWRDFSPDISCMKPYNYYGWEFFKSHGGLGSPIVLQVQRTHSSVSQSRTLPSPHPFKGSHFRCDRASAGQLQVGMTSTTLGVVNKRKGTNWDQALYPDGSMPAWVRTRVRQIYLALVQ